MLKKACDKSFSFADLAPEDRAFASKLKTLLLSYAESMRKDDPNDVLDLATFMLYCSYVSCNADKLGLKEFDHAYSIDEASANLGNKYLAAGFIEYYAGLSAQSDALADLRGVVFRSSDLSNAISGWIKALHASGLSLVERGERALSSAIWFALIQAHASGVWGKNGFEFSTLPFIANLAATLVGVKGKTALDFACGNGAYLGLALLNGAASICGRDISGRAVTKAKIGCFFADPIKRHDIAEMDAFEGEASTTPAQCIFAAPPFGMRLRRYDLQGKAYYARVMASLLGNEAAPTPDVEDYFVAKSFDSLADDGVAIVHVASGFLFHQQKARQSLRRALIEGGYLRTVVELPVGCVPGSAVKSALLVIGKRPSSEGVLVVDLDSKELPNRDYVIKGRGTCEITGAGIAWLSEVVQQQKEIPAVSIVVDRERLIDSGSNLCYSTYGAAFDYKTALDQIRPVAKVVNDIEAAQKEIDSLGRQIADILDSIETKG